MGNFNLNKQIVITQIMAFPFTIKHTKTLKQKLSKDEKEIAFEYIEKFLKDKSARNVFPTYDGLVYKGSTSWYNWNILRAVDKGEFIIFDNDETSVLSYEFFMYKLLIFSTFAGAFFWIVSGEYLVGLGAILWLGGMNWLINLARHGGMFDEIEEGINDLIWPKPPEEVKEPEDDDWAKGELKSWF
jgi:hypothetical protein